MIVFNTTYHVDDKIHDEIIDFFKKHFIPKATQSKRLNEPRFYLIHAQHEEHGRSYSLQFRIQDLETLEKWMKEEGGDLQLELSSRFGEQVCGFMTLLEEVEL